VPRFRPIVPGMPGRGGTAADDFSPDSPISSAKPDLLFDTYSPGSRVEQMWERSQCPGMSYRDI